MRAGFKGFGFLGHIGPSLALAASMAMIAMGGYKSSPPLPQAPKPLPQAPKRPTRTFTKTRWRQHYHGHRSEADRLWDLTPFINEYNANAMNFLPGRITCKLMKRTTTMSREASEILAKMKARNPKMRTNTYGSHA